MARTQAEIRVAVRHSRDSRAISDRRELSDAICTRLLDLPAVMGATCVAAFAPLTGEPDIWPALHQLRERGCDVLLPRVCGPRRLEWGAYETDTTLVAGRWGILEPTGAAHDLVEASAIVVPSVAVDPASGTRIGYGGGFYDTALEFIVRAHRGGPLRVAVCFDDEVIDGLTANEWDAQVDVIVTPARTIVV